MFTHSCFLSNPCKFIFAARSGQARVWLTRGGFKEVIHGRHVREEQINSDARGPNWQSVGNSRPNPSSWPLSDTWMGGVMESTFGWWNGELTCTPSSHHLRRQPRPPLLSPLPDLPLVGEGGYTARPHVHAADISLLQSGRWWGRFVCWKAAT